MNGVELIGRIRRAYFNQKLPIKEIVRTFSVSRMTVHKLSTADEISPFVANEISPLCFGSVASVAAGRLDVGKFGQVEIHNGLECLAGGGAM